jgi:hypothetical protein
MKLNSMKVTPTVKAKSVVIIHTEHPKEHIMDVVIKVIEGVGEVGIDTEASPGNGKYYVKSYVLDYDAVGFDTLEDALLELESVA